MAKISLCMIVGNVEEYIERCLKSFLPIADEVILVRAIGNQVPDGTQTKAAQVVADYNLENEREVAIKLAEYINNKKVSRYDACKDVVVIDAETKDWPHVDDFAAARQMSFDLATGEYLFWCDSDDVLESGADIVRQLADRGGYAAFIFPYRIFGRGVVVPRERMLLKGSGQWRYPVHECYDFKIQPVQAIEDQRVVITHMPHIATKTGSNERNLRILKSIPEAEMSAGLLFHLSGELGGSGDVAGSVEAAQKALAMPELGRPERYDLLLNLAFKTKQPEQMEALLHAAYKADPRRREALFLLTNNALNFGQTELACAYGRQMMATRVPAVTDWNHREACYGWAAADLWQQCLRASGFFAAAETMRREELQRVGGPRIALVHATRGRPRQASQARKIWLDMANKPEQIEHIFVFDEDDAASLPLSRMHHLKVPSGGGCVMAWNRGLPVTSAPVVVQMSDDWLPPMKWDELILERLGDVSKPSVLAISDGHRTDQLLCMAIATRAYFLQDCFMFHPAFKSMHCDDWFTMCAYERKQVIEARDLVFRHDHPFFTGAALDKTYAESNASSRYAQGREVLDYLARGTDWSTVPGFFDYYYFYESVAAKLKDGDTICEVGVWLGRSLIYLAQLLKQQGKQVKILAVDTFKGESNQKEHEATVKAAGGNLRASFEANLVRCGVRDMVTIIEGDSAVSASQVTDGALAFCFIDAAHDYESVKADIAAWHSKVRSGGALAGHDAYWHEVEKAVKEQLPAAQIDGPCWMIQL